MFTQGQNGSKGRERRSGRRNHRDGEQLAQLIAKTTTATGLTVTCRLDRRKYRTGCRVTKAERQALNLLPDRFHGEWHYVIKPRARRSG